MVTRFVIVFILLIIAACSSSRSLFQPTEAEAEKMNASGEKVSINELRKGYSLYVANCGGCHALPVPSSKNKNEWEKVLPEMFSKIQLDTNQKSLIRNYIHSKL